MLECRAQVAKAAALVEDCWFRCDEDARDHEAARERLKRSLEADAEAEFREAKERFDDEKRRLARSRHEAELREKQQAEERAHRHELELIRARAQGLADERARRRRERVRYFQELTPEQRIHRLTACHQRGSDCEDLVLVLIDSAGGASERRRLVELHEQLVTVEPAADPRTPEQRGATPLVIASGA